MKRLLTSFFLAVMTTSAYAGESVTYEIDGKPYEGYVAKAENAKGTVMIIHDWDGVDQYEHKRADMLAELGYNAFAVDLFGKGNRPDTTEGRQAETAKLYGDRELMRKLIAGGLDAARKQADGAVVVIGYCFGGAAALEMARSGMGENIKGYVSFHGGLTTPEGQSYPAETPPILIAHGGADTSVTMAHVATLSEELEKASLSYEIEVYSGAPHAFTVFGSERYRETADQKSWESFKEFLSTTLGS